MNDAKRLIEDYLPIQAISAEASREKSVRKGHISTLHLWWARRPLVACRAAVYGALVPASKFIPDNSPDNKKQSLGRANTAKFIERLCKYPANPTVIKEAQRHILEAHAERLTRESGKRVTAEDIEQGRAPLPKVLDMFAGGGAIPLEALRLGCETYALELNPVAHVIELCTLIYPQLYGKPNPEVKGMTGAKNTQGQTTWGGLASEVRYWGERVLKKVKADIGDLYPFISDCDKSEGSHLAQSIFPGPEHADRSSPGYLQPVAYLWTRTVRCKNPSCAAEVPLVKQTWLCKKKEQYVAIKIVTPRGQKKVRFVIVEAATKEELGFDPSVGSKSGNAVCPYCGTVADSDYVKAEGCAKRMGQHMMAIVCKKHGRQGKVYLSADDHAPFIPDNDAILRRIEELSKKAGLSVPDEPLTEKLTDQLPSYGMASFSDIFSPRQMLCLLSFAAAIRELDKQQEYARLDDGRQRALVTMLACNLDKLADFNSSLCILKPDGGRGIVHTFGRQALAMVWDYAEANPFNPEIASWDSSLREIITNIEILGMQNLSRCASVTRGSALALPWNEGQFDAILTDPPYYDNIQYAALSDFFYIWLKRSIGKFYPEHFTTRLSPKRDEATASQWRHKTKRGSRSAYEAMMAQSFKEGGRVLKPGGVIVVVYAHKTTLGWESLIEALRLSGFIVLEAWPLDTETKGRLLAHESAALASSIFLVARKREDALAGSYEDEVRPELDRIVRERVDSLWKMGITGADLVIAAVGAGLRSFTRFRNVEYANGEEVPTKKFLAEIEGVVLETLLEKIFGVESSGVSAIDGPSRFYVLWRYTYRAAEMDAGEAIVFTYGQEVELDGQRGLSTGNRALVEKKKGKYRLRDFAERGDDEKLGTPTDDGSPASIIDILHRIVWLMENQPRKLNQFLDEVRPDSERLRLVAQILAGTALAGKKDDGPEHVVATTAPEQAALKKMLANWRVLIDQRLAGKEGLLFELMPNPEGKK